MVDHAPFVGRAPELECLRALWPDAADGRLRIALVEGEAGIGKTRLVAEAVAAAGALGFEVFSASCAEHESTRAFAPLAAALGHFHRCNRA